MSLENLFKARTQSKGILVPLLNEYLLLEGKKPSGRTTGVFHPSEISGFFCPRQWVIKERHRAELPADDILPGLMRVFEIGHRLHDMMQDFIGSMGLMYGTYTCVKCDTDHLGFRPESCTKCGAKRFDYGEVSVDDDDFHIDGHTDGIVVIGDIHSPFRKPKKYIFEFKTINSMGFKALRKPLEAHREQGSIYLVTLEKARKARLAELEAAGVDRASDVYLVESLPFDGVILLYINKGEQPADGLHDLKEYLVTQDEAQELMKAKYPLLEDAWHHYENGTYPHRVCQSRTEAHQRRCPKAIIDLCFGTLHDR